VFHSPSESSPLTRRRFLVGSGLGLVTTAGLVEGLLLEPDRLSVTSHVLGVERPGAAPIRLAVLADLHLKSISDLHERIARAIGEAEPDIVLLVGDSIDAVENLPLLSALLELLPDGGLRVATLGNWEHWSRVDVGELRRVYERGSTRLLVNEGMEVDDRVSLFGTDDALAGSPSLDGLVSDPGHETVVLSHSPIFRDAITAGGTAVRAVISGHTHGGQVAIGGWAPIRPPGSGRYVSGWYREGGPDLFVSRGIGTSLIPVRLGSTPELAIIDWYPRSG